MPPIPVPLPGHERDAGTTRLITEPATVLRGLLAGVMPHTSARRAVRCTISLRLKPVRVLGTTWRGKAKVEKGC
jgi:hypothetical protein